MPKTLLVTHEGGLLIFPVCLGNIASSWIDLSASCLRALLEEEQLDLAAGVTFRTQNPYVVERAEELTRFNFWKYVYLKSEGELPCFLEADPDGGSSDH